MSPYNTLNPLNMIKAVVWRVSSAMRESGQALERTGANLQGIMSFQETTFRHTPLLADRYSFPSVAKGAFVAPSGLLTGDVTLAEHSSVWYNAIVRGEFRPVTIGRYSNIQDNAYVGASSEFSPEVEIGNNVSIGHGAVVKGAKIGDHTLIGINSVVSEGCKIHGLSIIAAGSYLEEDTEVPAGEVWAGNPAKKIRMLKPEEKEHLRQLPGNYKELAGQHKQVMDLLRMKQEEYCS